MPFIFNLLMTLTIAVVTGLGSVWLAVRDGAGIEIARDGPWEAWISAGNPDADPYTKAMLARTGRIPMASGEAINFRATTDSNGDRLAGNCSYLIVGGELDSRWWTLTVTDESERLIENIASRYAFNSIDVLRNNDGSFNIQLAPTAQSGNWIPTGGRQSLIMTLRLYDTPMISNGNIENPNLPRIVRGECES